MNLTAKLGEELTSNPFRLRVNVRPIRIAYFLLENDNQSLKRILQIANTQWGGIYHLVIPVSDSLEIWPLYESLVEFYDPDLFVAYWSEDKQQKELFEKALMAKLSAMFPHRKISIQDGRFFERSDQSAHTLGMIPEDTLREKTVRLHPITTSNQLGCVDIST